MSEATSSASVETPPSSLSGREALSAGWGMALGGAIVGLAGATLLGFLAVSAITTGIAAMHGYEVRGAEMIAGGLIVLVTTVVLALAGVALLLQLSWAPWVAFALAGLHLVGLGLNHRPGSSMAAG